MISPWGVFKALLCENYLESIKIAALLLSCRPGESRNVPVTQVEVAITYSSEKIAPALGRQAFQPANGLEGPLLISWPVTLRDEPEERTHDTILQALRHGSAAENTCNAFAERIKQKGNYCPWALGCQPGSTVSAPQIHTLPASFLGCRNPAAGSPSCYGHCLHYSFIIQPCQCSCSSACRMGFCSNTFTCNQLIKDTA